jgi:hypothetical protein
MNSLKTVFIVIVLAVLAGAVYVLVNDKASHTPPSEVADGWSDSTDVQMPDGLAPFAPGGGTSVDASMATSGGMAPPFEAKGSSFDAPGGGMAPPFTPSGGDPDGQTSFSPDAIEPSESALAGSGQGAVRSAFDDFLQNAREDLAQGKLAEVHQELSLWYDNPQLSPEESRQLTDLLDEVAGSVVYSREHLLERPYLVQSGDTLQRIGRKYGVPWQLLAKINRIADPENLEPGQELKVIRGPFEAVVHLDRHEMTVMLRGLYAGRFPIGVGRDQGAMEGTFFVEDKLPQSPDPDSPLGRYWIKLNDRIGIHGTNDPRNVGASGGPGSICLEDRDIEDVHAILSIGSRVQILR